MSVERIKALKRGIMEQAASARLSPRFWIWATVLALIVMMFLIGRGSGA